MRQLDIVPRRQRQGYVGFRSNDRPHLHGVCVQQRSRSLHFNGLFERTQLHLKVQPGRLVEHQLERRNGPPSEIPSFPPGLHSCPPGYAAGCKIPPHWFPWSRPCRAQYLWPQPWPPRWRYSKGSVTFPVIAAVTCWPQACSGIVRQMARKKRVNNRRPNLSASSPMNLGFIRILAIATQMFRSFLSVLSSIRLVSPMSCFATALCGQDSWPKSHAANGNFSTA